MSAKTFLFFPIDIGLAHIVRSLVIAEELQAQGHRVIFALPKRKHAVLMGKTKVKVVDVLSALKTDSFESLYVFRNEAILRKQIAEERALIKKYRPDAVVVDYRLSALAASAIVGVKTYFLAHGTGLPYGAKLPNPGVPVWFYKLSPRIIKWVVDYGERWFLKPLIKIAKEYGNPYSLREWFLSLEYILPEPSFYFPPNETKLVRHYVGALEWKGFQNTKTPSWLKNIHKNGKTIYLSFGGTGFSPQQLQTFAVDLVNKGYRVIVSTGTICEPESFPKLANLYVAKYLPGKKISALVDVVVCHGGYGTMIDAIYSQTPVIAIPFNPEQLMHSWRMDELGVGYCLVKLNIMKFFGLLSFNFQIFEEEGKKIKSADLLRALEKVAQNKAQIQQKLAWFNKVHPYRDGAKEAAKIVASS